LYISASHLHSELPIKELKGFQKIYLKAGETKEVMFELEPKKLSYFVEGKRQILSGIYKIMIGDLIDSFEVLI
jgi:beta-glucosidase